MFQSALLTSRMSTGISGEFLIIEDSSTSIQIDLIVVPEAFNASKEEGVRNSATRLSPTLARPASGTTVLVRLGCSDSVTHSFVRVSGLVRAQAAAPSYEELVGKQVLVSMGSTNASQYPLKLWRKPAKILSCVVSGRVTAEAWRVDIAFEMD
jgi:hypothetical protein